MKKYLTPEEQHLQIPELIKKLRPIDDDFMRVMFKDNIPLIQLVLRIITGREDLIVTHEETQYDLEQLSGARSLCLDVLATDSLGRRYNLEVQRADKGASPYRARYHSSAMDIEFLKKNRDFEQLPVTYVIFITENDTCGQNKPVSIFERRDINSGKPLGDNEYIIYVNGAYNDPEDNSDLARLIHDFGCRDHKDMYFELMAERMEYYKEKTKGVSHMCKLVEDMLIERDEIATEKANLKIASKLLGQGKLTVEEIADLTELSIENVKALAEELKPALA